MPIAIGFERARTGGLVSRTVALAVACLALVACAREPKTEGGEPQMRRLTEAQYRNAIADIFGPDIVVAGRFEPLIRPDNGLLSDGAVLAAVSPAGFEQYDNIARNIAAQVVDETHRATLIPCQPKVVDAPDDDCATQFYSRVGRLLFRRPLGAAEVAMYVSVAREASEHVQDFYSGLALGLAGMLVSPKFLFHIDHVEPDPEAPGQHRLDGYSKATRLSLFLWNTIPDAELLDAAERGDLHQPRKLRAQVARMLESRRLEDGVRAFFSDMLAFERFEELSKDVLLYPKFNRELARDMQEQTLRTITHVLLSKDADYRELFTTRETFLTRPLGMIYRVPIDAQNGWQHYEFPEGDRRAGLLTQAGFVSMHSHSGRSSPTLRGMAIRELLMCQKVPDPPGNVDFATFEDTSNPLSKTARGRLIVHSTDPTCAGCHRIIDPIGLALENFDAIGEYRETENGEPIDPSGEIDGIPFEDAAGLGRVLAESSTVTDCLVRRAYQYAVGKPPSVAENELLQYLSKRFARRGYKLRELLMAVATSDALYRIAPAEPSTEETGERVVMSADGPSMGGPR